MSADTRNGPETEDQEHEQKRHLENSEFSAGFAARCRSYRRSRPRVWNRQNSGDDARPFHADEPG